MSVFPQSEIDRVGSLYEKTKQEAQDIADAIADRDDHELLRLTTHHAAMAAHWASVTASAAMGIASTGIQTYQVAGAIRWHLTAQTILLGLILWRVW